MEDLYTANSSIQNRSCSFCDELRTSRIHGIPDAPIENRIIMSTDNFFVVPSVAPLGPGHLMIIPNRHVKSMTSVDSCLSEEFNTLVLRVISKLERRYGSKPFVFEHGIASSCEGGCGISHAHLHLLPMSNAAKDRVISEVANSCGQSVVKFNLFSLLNSTHQDRSYLLVSPNAEDLFLYYGDHWPSQFLRKLIARQLELGHWDWNELFGWDDFLSTLRSLQHSE